MSTKRNKKGFTLLEVIIVIIIIGVLASLALPRLFSTVEYSRATEALNTMSSMRQSMERCYTSNNQTYAGATPCTISTLDLADPSTTPNTHFAYAIAGQTAFAYVITATRNVLDGGVATHTIIFTYNATLATVVTRSGTSAFLAVR